MRLAFATVVLLLLVCILGCAGRVEPIVLGGPTEPRASWIIRPVSTAQKKKAAAPIATCHVSFRRAPKKTRQALWYPSTLNPAAMPDRRIENAVHTEHV